jgi:hypothetical protein
VVRRSVIAFAVTVAAVLSSAVGAGAAQPGKLTFEDRIAAHATTSVTIVVHRSAAFSVRFRVTPTSGRTRVYLTGATAPKGILPLVDTKGGACSGAAGSWVCSSAYEPLPPGTYTFRIRHDAAVAGRFELNLSW